MAETPRAPATRGLTIVHTASLAVDDLPAFRHAVAIAQRSQSRLVSVHAGAGESARERIPRAANVLAGFGLVAEDADDHAVASVGVRHERVVIRADQDPVAELTAFLGKTSPDLLVATTEARKGLARLMAGSVAEVLARSIRSPALLFPKGCRGFVADATGKATIARVVVPAGDAAAAIAAANRLLWLLDVVGAGVVDVELVHAGEVLALEELKLPARDGVRWHEQAPTGSVEDAIVAAVEATDADLVVMATRGHDTFGDAIAGSHTERVLRRVSCPLLSVPIN